MQSTVFTGDKSIDELINNNLIAGIEAYGMEWDTLFFLIWSHIESQGFKQKHIDMIKKAIIDSKNGCAFVKTGALLDVHLQLSCTDPVDTGSASQRQELIDVAEAEAKRAVTNHKSKEFYMKWREYAIKELKRIRLDDAEIEVWIEPITFMIEDS